jgi:hypothetical protein
MEEYELFDQYLKKSKTIREFCDDREKMMFESIRMDISTEGKTHWLKSIGYELDKVIAYIDRLTNDRKPQFQLKK